MPSEPTNNILVVSMFLLFLIKKIDFNFGKEATSSPQSEEVLLFSSIVLDKDEMNLFLAFCVFLGSKKELVEKFLLNSINEECHNHLKMIMKLVEYVNNSKIKSESELFWEYDCIVDGNGNKRVSEYIYPYSFSEGQYPSVIMTKDVYRIDEMRLHILSLIENEEVDFNKTTLFFSMIDI